MRQKGVLFDYFARLTVESLLVSDAERPKISTTFLQNSRKNIKTILISNTKPTHLNLAKPVVYN